MPHKRAKRSVREAEKKNRQTDLAPTALAAEPIPKGLARVLGAEEVRAAYRRKRREEASKSGTEARGKETVTLLPGESLKEFNRRVEDAHRPLVRAAMKHKGKGKEKEKEVEGKESVGQVVGKRKREEEPVKEFATVSSSAPRRLNEVAMAPPVLTKGPRGVKSGGVGKGPVSMARKVVLEQERERAIEMYRALKKRG